MRSDPSSEPRRPSRWGRNWRAIRLLLIAYGVVLLAMMWLEESLIFIPLDYATDDWHPSGLPIEEAQFQAADGTRLHGWYVAHPHPRAAVLFCHGNAGNVTHRVDVLHELHGPVGVSVLIFDYRGYGHSEKKKPSEAGVLADARAARAWLALREKIPENRIVLMGESIGGAVAVDLATDGARALVLESTFSSLPDVAAYHYPWLPVRWLMRTRLDSAAKIGKFHGPLLQSHCQRDTIVPIQFGRRLFEAANEPKRLITFPTGDHNDFRPAFYYADLAKFLATVP
jgi:fermentation-respiration switch protein FrsA (DUF1100 family)